MGDKTPVDYSKISQIYDISRGANTETTGKLLKILNSKADSVILDLGCGTGNYAASLQRAANVVIGIDISIEMLGKARIKFPASQFIWGDVTALPFKSQTLDGAFAIQVLHHIKSREVFLREVHRVLRRGAWFAVHSCSHQQMRAFWFYHYFPKGLEVDLARIPDSKEIAFLLGKAGFSDIGAEVCYSDVVVKDETPENYLDRSYRDGVSTFSMLTEEDIKTGCERIKRDIASGAVEDIVRQAEEEVAKHVGGSTIVYGRRKNISE